MTTIEKIEALEYEVTTLVVPFQVVRIVLNYFCLPEVREDTEE